MLSYVEWSIFINIIHHCNVAQFLTQFLPPHSRQSNHIVGDQKMIVTAKTFSIFARCRTQVRCLSSFPRLTQTTIRSDDNGYLNQVAENANRTYCLNKTFPDSKIRCNQLLLQFEPATQILQPRSDYEPTRQIHDNLENLEAAIQAMNRNARRPKKANKGSRPCSRAGRRSRKEKIGKRSRG